MARLLITGASGLLGFNLVLASRTEHEVVAVYNQFRIDIPGIHAVQKDLTHELNIVEVIGQFSPDCVINCAAATNVDECEKTPELAMELNFELPRNLARVAASRDLPLIHTSTDAVFNGEHGHYQENDEVDPINHYARSKALGESAVLQEHGNAAVIRTNIFGWNIQPKQSLSEWFLSKLESGIQCPGFTDVLFSPILVNDLALILLRFAQSKRRGIYHVGGSTCLSKYAFGKGIAQMAGLNEKLILPAEVESVELLAKRPKSLCLEGSKIERELGFKLPSVEAGLKRFISMRESWANRQWDVVSERANNANPLADLGNEPRD